MKRENKSFWVHRDVHAIHIKLLSVSSWSSILFFLFNAKKNSFWLEVILKGKAIYYYYMDYYRFCWKRKAEHQQQEQSITLIIVITDKTSYIFYDHITTPYNRMFFNCWWSTVREWVYENQPIQSSINWCYHFFYMQVQTPSTQPTLCCNRTVHVSLLCTWEN